MSDRPYDQVQPAQGDSTSQVAANEAKGVAQDAKESGAQVAGAAKEQTRQVAGEAKQQAEELFHQVRGELTDQSSTQQHRAAGGLHSLADELSTMADGSQQSGVASDFTRQAASRAHSVADWLDSREPGDVVDELRRFARRKPGTFVAAAAVLGFIGGRLTRGLKEEHDDSTASQGPSTAYGTGAGYTATDAAYAGTDYAETAYREPGYAQTGYGATATGEPTAGLTTAAAGTGDDVAPETGTPVVTTTNAGETFTHTTGSGTGGFEEERR